MVRISDPGSGYDGDTDSGGDSDDGSDSGGGGSGPGGPAGRDRIEEETDTGDTGGGGDDDGDDDVQETTPPDTSTPDAPSAPEGVQGAIDRAQEFERGTEDPSLPGAETGGEQISTPDAPESAPEGVQRAVEEAQDFERGTADPSSPGADTGVAQTPVGESVEVVEGERTESNQITQAQLDQIRGNAPVGGDMAPGAQRAIREANAFRQRNIDASDLRIVDGELQTTREFRRERAAAQFRSQGADIDESDVIITDEGPQLSPDARQDIQAQQEQRRDEAMEAQAERDIEAEAGGAVLTSLAAGLAGERGAEVAQQTPDPLARAFSPFDAGERYDIDVRETTAEEERLGDATTALAGMFGGRAGRTVAEEVTADEGDPQVDVSLADEIQRERRRAQEFQEAIDSAEDGGVRQVPPGTTSGTSVSDYAAYQQATPAERELMDANRQSAVDQVLSFPGQTVEASREGLAWTRENVVQPGSEVAGDLGGLSQDALEFAAFGGGERAADVRESTRDILRPEDEEVSDPNVAEYVTQRGARGAGGAVAGVTVGAPAFAETVGRTGYEAGEYTAEAIEEEGVVGGTAESAAAAGGATYGFVRSEAERAIENPYLFTGEVAGGAAIGAGIGRLARGSRLAEGRTGEVIRRADVGSRTYRRTRAEARGLLGRSTDDIARDSYIGQFRGTGDGPTTRTDLGTGGYGPTLEGGDVDAAMGVSGPSLTQRIRGTIERSTGRQQTDAPDIPTYTEGRAGMGGGGMLRSQPDIDAPDDAPTGFESYEGGDPTRPADAGGTFEDVRQDALTQTQDTLRGQATRPDAGDYSPSPDPIGTGGRGATFDPETGESSLPTPGEGALEPGVSPSTTGAGAQAGATAAPAAGETVESALVAGGRRRLREAQRQQVTGATLPGAETSVQGSQYASVSPTALDLQQQTRMSEVTGETAGTGSATEPTLGYGVNVGEESTVTITPDTDQDVTPDEGEDIFGDTTPETTPDQTEDTTPDTTPDTRPDTTPDVTPDPRPTPSPDPTPGLTPDFTPDPTPRPRPDPTPDPTPTPDDEEADNQYGLTLGTQTRDRSVTADATPRGPGWYSEYVTVSALGLGADRGAPTQAQLEERPEVEEYTSTLPTAAQVDPDEEEREALEEAEAFFGFGDTDDEPPDEDDDAETAFAVGLLGGFAL